jgi:hypothetical protein
MNLKWHEGQLTHGRVLVRGWLRKDSPLHATVEAFYLCNVRGLETLDLVVATYVCDGSGSELKFLYPPWAPQHWLETWREATVGWGRGRQTTFGERCQVVMLGDDANNAQPVPPGDPRLLLHYGTLLEAIQSQADGGGMLGQLKAAQTVAPKLRELIKEQFRVWKKVVPV